MFRVTESLNTDLKIRAADRTMRPQIKIVALIPNADAAKPISGEPIGVPPMKIKR